MLKLSDIAIFIVSLIVLGGVLRSATRRTPTPEQASLVKPRTLTRLPRPAARKLWTPIYRTIVVTLGAATLIGGAAAVLYFWPRMTVTPAGLFDNSNAYSQIFTISNTGFLPFEEVHIGFGICSIETEKHDFIVTGDMCADNDPHFLFSAPSWQTPELRRDEPFSIVLSDSLNIATAQYRAAHPRQFAGTQMMSPLKATNIIFHIGFTPWPWPKPMALRYRFVAKQEPNGAMLWRAVPLSWTEIKLP